MSTPELIMRWSVMLVVTVAMSSAAQKVAAQDDQGLSRDAVISSPSPELRLVPSTAGWIWTDRNTFGNRPVRTAAPSATYWREGAIFGGILTGLPLVAWGLSACEDGCVWRVKMGAVVGALPGAVVGALIGGQVERR